ncbi:MAG: DUF4230 domain-containing protein [Bacteroidales bacterium]|nr:DUF4230 domain-containing protein [Bacteroidales bacterium]
MKQNNIIRYIPVLAIIVLVLVAAALLWLKLKPKDEGLKIDETANVVTEIRKIAQFTSACYYEDVILKDKKANESLGGKVVNSFSKKDKPILEDEIVIVASGNVRAGFDLSKLSEKDIVIRDSVLEVTLPKAEIFEVIVNPSGFDVYIEDGTWSHEQVTKVENKAMNKIRKDAISDGLLEKATELGVTKLTELFKTFGYKEVVIHTK